MKRKYRVTPRGKVVFSAVAIVVLVLLFMFIQSLQADPDIPVENSNAVETVRTNSDQKSVGTKTDDESGAPESSDSTSDEMNTTDKIEEENAVEAEETHTSALDREALVNAKTTVYFEPDQYVLNDEYKLVLNIFIGIAKEHPDEFIKVEGNINGYPKFNDSKFGEELSQIRADKVAQYLKNMGIAEDKIKIQSNGSSKPLNKSDSAEELMLNRRTDVYFEDYLLEDDAWK